MPVRPTQLPLNIIKDAPVEPAPPTLLGSRREAVKTLVASAKQLVKPRSGQRDPLTQTKASWQDDAWELFDLVGELRFLLTTVARQMSMAKLEVHEVTEDENSPNETQVTDDEEAAAIIDALGQADGITSLIERLALNLLVAGEGWLVGEPLLDDGTPNPEPPLTPGGNLDLAALSWSVLSTAELSSQDSGNKVAINKGDGLKHIHPFENVHVVRIWQGHPRRGWEATSMVQAAIAPLQQIVGLSMHTAAQIDSRLGGAGVLLVPDEAQTAIEARYNDRTDGTAADDVLLDMLMEAMLTPIQDRSSAAAVVPITLSVPSETTDKFKHLSFDRPLDSAAPELVNQALHRLAVGLDAPPELLLGTGAMNHWGAWLVKEDTVNSHLKPTLALICNALTREVLWPMLEGLGWSDDELMKYTIQANVEHLVIRPQAADDAKDLHKAKVISDEALRRATGFSESDAPEEDETEEPPMVPVPPMPPNVTEDGEDDGTGNLPTTVGDPATAKGP